MKTLLFLDDFRDPFEDNWIRYSPIGTDCDIVWVKTYQEFVDRVMCYGLPDAICFDHDLGTHNGNGYECAKFLIDYCINNNLKLPLYAIQSANPVGKENIDSLLKNYIKNCE